jgi:hypothetical protein
VVIAGKFMSTFETNPPLRLKPYLFAALLPIGLTSLAKSCAASDLLIQQCIIFFCPKKMQKNWKSGRHGKNIILTILEIFYPFGAYYILYPLDNLTQQRQTPPVDH